MVSVGAILFGMCLGLGWALLLLGWMQLRRLRRQLTTLKTQLWDLQCRTNHLEVKVERHIQWLATVPPLPKKPTVPPTPKVH